MCRTNIRRVHFFMRFFIFSCFSMFCVFCFLAHCFVLLLCLFGLFAGVSCLCAFVVFSCMCISHVRNILNIAIFGLAFVFISQVVLV